ncbi:hypothetical protein [Streptomyces sp. CA-106110]|uniref:hypothetical protein n=1 Tax=Streptomyces sp. CA-106110 TaxID=3240044 RepID=UPI003D9329EF
MQYETTINELPKMQGLFTAVDHITVLETDPNTGRSEEVSLPPPLIRCKERRDGTTEWILTPPGIPERIHVADQAAVTVYMKDVDTGRFTGHIPQPQPQPQAVAPAPWPQQPHQAAHPAPPATPQRRAAPWSQQTPG